MDLIDDLNGRDILQRVFRATEIDQNDSIKVKTATFCALGDVTEAMIKVNKSLEQPLKVIQGGN